MWHACLLMLLCRDFLVCVVGAPAVLVGNSIGGFISASAAADYPALAAGLVLVNSAGPITPGYTSADAAAAAAEQKKPPPPWMVRLITMGLMAYLQNSIAKQLKWLYPTNPDNADEWLEREIYRCAVCLCQNCYKTMGENACEKVLRGCSVAVSMVECGNAEPGPGFLHLLGTTDGSGRGDGVCMVCAGLPFWLWTCLWLNRQGLSASALLTLPLA